MPESVRVRFAPSPTGDPHIGSIWTAMFNRIFVQQRSGQFVLRIEDTDQKRLVPGTQEKILEALDWYGLTPDEGPVQGGPYAPYVQSQRLDVYRKHALMLTSSKRAYYCFCTAERLESLRAEQTAAKQAPRYDKRCSVMAPEEAERRVGAGERAVIRLNVPISGQVVHHDIIRGDVTFTYAEVDDSVLLKSDGFPTYHLANVVDDHLMKISHVIRAEEWLPSVPKHLLLYQAFGWTPPQFAHLPLLLGGDKSKLSKRHGATAALSFRDEGYLPEAMRNFLVLMGWHPKGDEEILSDEQILKQFKLEDVNPSGAVFDRTKLDWMNGAYIRKMELDELVRRLESFWDIPVGASPSDDWKRQAVRLVRDRMKRLNEMNELINFAFPSVWDRERSDFDRQQLIPKKGSISVAAEGIQWFINWLERTEVNEAMTMKTSALEAIAQAGKKNMDVLWPVRVALTLRTASPDIFDVIALIGKAEALRRLRQILG